MEFVSKSLPDYFQDNLPIARQRGFMWVVTLLAREADVDGLYTNLKNAWNSLDSITGKYFLFIFAGKEKDSTLDNWLRYAVSKEQLQKNYYINANDFIKVINPDVDFYDAYIEVEKKEKQCMDYLERNQTLAVNALKDYFSIRESEIPCLIFTRTDGFARQKYNTVTITGNDIYRYFKNLFNKVDPLLKQFEVFSILLEEVRECKKEAEDIINGNTFNAEIKILLLQKELLEYAKEDIRDINGNTLRYCVNNLVYGKFQKPYRGVLNKYIDLVKNYEKKTGRHFNSDEVTEETRHTVEIILQAQNTLMLMKRRENALVQTISDKITEIEDIIIKSKLENTKKHT